MAAGRKFLSSYPSSEGMNVTRDDQIGIDLSPLIVSPNTFLQGLVLQLAQKKKLNDSNFKLSATKPEERRSFALVMLNHQLLGIITEHDLVRLTAQGVCFADTAVKDVMTTRMVTIQLSQIKDVFTPLEIFRQYPIRHLPVLTEDDDVYGVITVTRLRQELSPSALLKRRQVWEVLDPQVQTTAPTTSVIEVAQIMAAHQVSCVVIQDSDQHPPLGIITEYDIVSLQRRRLDLETTIAQSIMSTPLRCLKLSDPLFDVQQKMQDWRVRRLVVVDDQGLLAGIVSQSGILAIIDPLEMAAKIELLNAQVEQLQGERIRLLNDRANALELQVQDSETSLLLYQEKFRSTFEQAAVGIAHISLDGHFMIVNQRFGEILGYDPTELVDHHFSKVTHPEDHTESLECIEKLLLRELSSFTHEIRHVRRDGNIIWLNMTFSVAKNLAGDPDYLILVLEDISSRKQSEASLERLNQELEDRVAQATVAYKASELRYRMLFESAPDIIFVLSLQGKIQDVNTTALECLGYSKSELIGQDFQDFFLVGLLTTHQKNFEELLLKGSSRKEMEVRSKDGAILPVDCACCVIDSTLDKDPKILVIQRNISRSKLLESKLRDAEQQMRTIFEAMHDFVLICSVKKGKVANIEIAPTNVQENSIDAGEVLQQTVQMLLHSTDKSLETTIQNVLSLNEANQFEYCLMINAHELWFMANISRLSEEHVLWVARDISALKLAEKALYQEKELAQVTLESIGDAVITTDIQGNIDQLNPVAEDLMGWQTSEVRNRRLSEVFNIIHEETRAPVENPVEKALSRKSVVELEKHTVLLSRDGTEYAIEDSAAPIRDRDNQVVGAVMVFHDVTKARKLNHQLSWQASHDPLTRLCNRRKFDQILKTALELAHFEHIQHVLCFLDLDQFKVVNDTCGHAAGDELLCQVTKLMMQSIRAIDTLARIGGDEFVILLHQCPLEHGINIAEKLLQSIQAFRFHWADQIFTIGVSIGILKVDHHSTSSDDLLGEADAACYVAKARGRNRIQVYQDNDHTLIQQRGHQQWSIQINQALENNLFRLYGQAIMPTSPDYERGRFCEILLRLTNEQQEIISAGVFLPAAERYNLMQEIDRWVISTFLDKYYPYLTSHLEDLQSPELFMINLSGSSLCDEKFLPFLKQKLLAYSEIASRICFEITETAVISNLNQAVEFIQELKQLGCQFALDDFGAGMSSFAYLKTLPVDYLKIDGRLIDDITDDTAACAIVESINHIGHVMGLPTIAECVCSDSIRTKLCEIGVDYVQGFAIDMPQRLRTSWVSM